VKATRVKEGETSSQIKYFISSVELGAARMMTCIRRHWEVENKRHWSLDVSFRKIAVVLELVMHQRIWPLFEKWH
jgi:predicted transposase YbfD/YdcC